MTHRSRASAHGSPFPSTEPGPDPRASHHHRRCRYPQCFDMTKGLAKDSRPGGHEKLDTRNLPEWSGCTLAHRFKSPRKVTFEHTKKGDGMKIKAGLLKSSREDPKPPKAQAFKTRANPPNTLFRKFYERNDLPVAVEHK